VAATQTTPSHSRPPFYRDVVVIKWISQVVVLILVVSGLLFFAAQAGSNLRAKNIETSWRFLSVKPGIQLGEGIDVNPSTGARALWVGMVNTIRVSAVGLILATILGTIIGVARLSKNWIVNKLSTTFIEIIRNVPLLVQILFWAVVIRTWSEVDFNLGPIHNWFMVSQKGIALPRIFPSTGFYQWMVVVLIGAYVGRRVYHQRETEREETGRETHALSTALGIVAVFAAVGLLIHPLFGFLGPIFTAIGDVLDAIPILVVQLLLSAAMVAAAGLWIKRFLDNLRTPAGLAKLTDDDIFRIIFAGFSALMGIVLVFVIWPGLSAWLIHSLRDFFHLLGDKFEWLRTGRPLDGERPRIVQTGRFPNFSTSGLVITKEFAALLFGVVLYTAAFIAEIVRAGILAVPKGQTEAAGALGLSRGLALRKVVLPQAMRVILPPMGNQYLNLVKNTSLAIAVGFADLVQVGQTLYNQTGRTLEVVAIWMGFYLGMSLLISVVVNFFNVRLRIVER